MNRREILQSSLVVAPLGLAAASVVAQEASAPATVTFRKEFDSLGEVNVPADKLWGAQTQRSLEHFSIGKDLIPREMITSYAILKRRPPSPTTTASGSTRRIQTNCSDLR